MVHFSFVANSHLRRTKIKCGATVRLQHLNTRRFLHRCDTRLSCSQDAVPLVSPSFVFAGFSFFYFTLPLNSHEFPSPLTQNQEVSAFADGNGNSDQGMPSSLQCLLSFRCPPFIAAASLMFPCIQATTGNSSATAPTGNATRLSA